jgi:hypothetical protein
MVLGRVADAGGGSLSTARLDGVVAKPRNGNPTVFRACCHAFLVLGQGTLEFLRRPDRPSIEEGIGTVSRLRVSHDDEIFVTVAVEGEPQPRVLALKPGSDVAIVNGLLETDPAKTGDPLTLFKKIAKSGTFTLVKSLVEPSVPVISGSYQVFKIKLPIKIASDPGCSSPPWSAEEPRCAASTTIAACPWQESCGSY